MVGEKKERERLDGNGDMFHTDSEKDESKTTEGVRQYEDSCNLPHQT